MNPFKRLAARTAARVLAKRKSNAHFRDAYASLTYTEINRDQFAGVSAQEKMLADDVRFDAYRRNVAKHIHFRITELTGRRPIFASEPRTCRKGDVLDFNMKIYDIQSMESWSIEV